MTVDDYDHDPGDESTASETAVKPCHEPGPGHEDSPAGPGDGGSIMPADEKEKPVTSFDTSEDGNDAKSNSNSEHDDVELGHPPLPGTSREPDGPPLRRIASSFANTTTRIVPRADRRGLLGRFAVIPEIENPYQYKNTTKWMITAVVSLAAAGAPLGTSIFLPALPSMSHDLGVSQAVTNLTVAFYMLAMSIFPLWWSSFSETLGRRTIYIVSFTLFVIFSVLSAVSVNISMLIVMRVLGGGASASVQAVGAGTIADIWEPAERGLAMGVFYLGPLMGPLFAPIIGGALAEGFSWRATMWFLTIFGAVMLLMLLFCLPETLVIRPAAPPDETTGSSGERPANPLRRVSTAQSIKNTASVLKRLFIDPLSVLVYLRYPPVLITVYSASIAFGALYVLNISIQSTFSKPPYSFSSILLGLLYIAPSTGYVLGSMLGGRWIDVIMAREARRARRYDADGKLVYLPEDRMRENMWLAGTLYPGALIWYGWTAEKGLHWIIPSIANLFFGVGSMLVFGVVTTMLTEFMPKRSSSGVAINNFVRNIFSCVGGVVAQPLIGAMGNGWLFTMLGLVAWVTGNLAVLALRRKGPEWRAEMDKKLNQSS